MDATNSESSSPSPSASSLLSSPPPESFFVFVVGHCEEWPKNRAEQGDAAIYKEYLDCCVPAEQCLYIKDDDCTMKNCQEQLEMFLRRQYKSSAYSSSLSQVQAQTQPQLRNYNSNISNNDKQKQPQPEKKQHPTTLVFYYGGHGSANGFDTIGSTWTYSEVAQSIEELFHGDRVLFLLDCCASGNLWRHLPSSSSSCTQYALVATSQPYITSSSGEEWIMTNSWIQLMRCRSPNGITNTDNDDIDLSLEELISLMADRHAFELGDLLFAYLTAPTPKLTTTRNNNHCLNTSDCWSWMPSVRCRQRQTDSSSTVEASSDELSSSKYQMPKEGKILSVHDCRVGDAVAYKHLGGHPVSIATSSSTNNSASTVNKHSLPFYVPPLWLHATIISIFETQHRNRYKQDENNTHHHNILLRIRVQYPSQPHEPWEVDVSHDQLMNHFFVAQLWMLPRAFRKTQVMLARKYQQYLDCSVAAYTSVRVVSVLQQQPGDDNEQDEDAAPDSRPTTTREGTILDWKEFNWKHLLYCNNNADSGSSNVFPGKTNYDQYYFDELPVPIKMAAVTFGYTKSNWDDDVDIPADSQDWDELTEAQKEAATVLGYVRLKLSVDSERGSGTQLLSFSQNVLEISTCAGAHVPVEWNDNHHSCLVPLKHIVFPDSTTRRNNDATSTMTSSTMIEQPDHDEEILERVQQQCLIRSLESTGKSIGKAESILGTTELSAYWPDDEEWYDATPIDIVYNSKEESNNHNNNNELSLKLLATHFEYPLPGVYCPIVYEDGVRYLVPLTHIYKRGCQPQQYEGDDDDDQSACSTEASSLLPIPSFPTEEVIDEMLKHLCSITSKASSFGEGILDVASKIEEASKLIHDAFEMKKQSNNDDLLKQLQQQEEQSQPKTDKQSPNTLPTSAETSLKSYIDYNWSDLPKHVKKSAQRIGYNNKLWDLDEYIPIESKEWKHLTRMEEEALEIIGYNELNWNNNDDDVVDSDDDY